MPPDICSAGPAGPLEYKKPPSRSFRDTRRGLLSSFPALPGLWRLFSPPWEQMRPPRIR